MIWLRRREAILRVAMMLLSAATVGCGGRDGPPDVQVAARVNKDEITVHQVQHVLQRQARLAAEFPEAAARTVLDSLVEQELAAQAARAQGLDKEPAVVQAMEAARREVLARAFQDRLADKASGPSSDDIDRYYESHPGLFAQRRIYTVQEFLVQTTEEAQVERVKAIAGDAKAASDLEQRLGQAGLRYRTRLFAQAPEDMPLGMVEAMSALGPGRSVARAQPVATRVFTVVNALPAPLDRRSANEAIASFLVAERKRSAVAEGMKAVREAARIEYVGNFATAAAAPASAASR